VVIFNIPKSIIKTQQDNKTNKKEKKKRQIERAILSREFYI